MKLANFFRMAAGIIGLASLIPQAQANVISYGDSFAFTQATLSDTSADYTAQTLQGPNQVIFLPMFDSALGTLTGVEISFDTVWSFSSTFRATDPYGNIIGTGGSGTSATDMRVRLVDPKTANGKNTVERIKVVNSNDCLSDSLACRDNDNLGGQFSGLLDWSGGLLLADFIGTDNLKFSMFRKMTADLLSCGYNDSCFQKNRLNNWAGDISISYTYVPEPSILLLMGVGLLGLCVVRRTRTRPGPHAKQSQDEMPAAE